jgi:hypothetical protein
VRILLETPRFRMSGLPTVTERSLLRRLLRRGGGGNFTFNSQGGTARTKCCSDTTEFAARNFSRVSLAMRADSVSERVGSVSHPKS